MKDTMHTMQSPVKVLRFYMFVYVFVLVSFSSQIELPTNKIAMFGGGGGGWGCSYSFMAVTGFLPTGFAHCLGMIFHRFYLDRFAPGTSGWIVVVCYN